MDTAFWIRHRRYYFLDSVLCCFCRYFYKFLDKFFTHKKEPILTIKNSIKITPLILVMLMLSGCFINARVESYQIGLVLEDGVSIKEVVGPGIHTNNAWRAELVTINTSNITTAWNDPSLVTRDKQPIGLSMSITFSRKRDSESITNLYNRYNNESSSDEALTNLVLSKVPGVAKTITTRYTLDQMLGIDNSVIVSGTTPVESVDRTVVAQAVSDLLESELDQIYVDLAAVEISDIAPSPDFLQALNAKAQAQINIEVAAQETKLITEQLAQEKAQTQIELEKARRENEVNAVMAQAYEESPQLLQLRMLELTAEMLDEGDTVIYVPQGSNITNVLTQSQSEITPIE